VPDFDAETKFPYGSTTSMRGRALGHNLIHRNCGEVDKQCCQWVCVKFDHAYVFLWKSMTWRAARGLAHIVFHNLCEKLGDGGGMHGVRPVIKNYAGEIYPLNSTPLI
jgi:hypothetical protein